MTLDHPVFVLSLLLSPDDGSGEVVLGVRQPLLQTPRHAGVLSTPTQRLPRAFFEACRPAWPEPEDEVPVVVPLVPLAGEPVAVGVADSSSRPLAHLVESLLARKLGLSAALADGTVRGAAAPVAIAAAVVDDPQGGCPPEHTVMLSVDVRLVGLRAALPDRTCHYSPLLFAPLAVLAEALHRHDALIVSDRLDPFEVCVGGLCIASAVAVADDREVGAVG